MGTYAEQVELLTFQQEVCKDLHMLLQEQKVDAERRLHIESGRLHAVVRLESVLPKTFLMRASA